MRTAIYNAKEHLKSFFYTKFLLLSKKFKEGYFDSSCRCWSCVDF